MANDSNQSSQNNSGNAKGFQVNAKDSEVYQAGNDINIDRSGSTTFEQDVDGNENQVVAQANDSVLINKIGDGSTVNIYRTPALKLGAPFLVDPLPPYYVPRPEHSDVVKAELLATGEKATGTLVVSAIYGLGGIGKSVLARALAHDPEVQAHFKEGVLWVTLGQEPDLLPKLGGWLHALGDYNSKPTSMEVAVTQLRLLLQEKQMLLVIDDVWEPEHAEPFRVGGSNCCVLITTREAQIKNAQAHNLDEMSPEQALQMLKQRLPDSEFTTEDEEKARLLAKEVGYLPLALELAAAQVEDEVSWGELLEDLQAEIADLASFDGSGLALKTGKEEKQLRDRSLLASFNLSLKRLPREQLEQFAWLGIVQEDAEINKAIAAKLWGVKIREARALLQFFKQRALLMPGVGQREQATYRTHDLVRSISKRLLTSPAEGDGGFAFVGFETSLSEAHSILLGRYRETTASGLWHELEEDGYIFAQLTWHMEQAGQEAQVHQLFQETTAEGRNGWYEACDRLGKLSYFVTDLGRAWKLAEQLFEQDATEAIVLQWRYALIQTTLNSLAQNIPAELLVRFVETGFWSPEQSLVHLYQVGCPNAPYWPSVAMSSIAKHLPSSLLPEAWRITRDMQDEANRASTIWALAEYLPASLLDEALEVTRNMKDEFNLAWALHGLSPYLPSSILPKALEITRNISNEYQCFVALSALAPQLPESLLSEALEIHRDIKHKGNSLALLHLLTPDISKPLVFKLQNIALSLKLKCQRNWFFFIRHSLLTKLALHLPESLLPTVLTLTPYISSEYYREEVLEVLAPHLPESLLHKALKLTFNFQNTHRCVAPLRALSPHFSEFLMSEALELTRDIKNTQDRIELIGSLAPYLSVCLLPQALKLTRNINDKLKRASVLNALMSKFPELGCEALELIRNAEDESELVQALAELAPNFPEFLFPKLLEISRDIVNERERAWMLCQLAPKSPELWIEALEATHNIEDISARAWMLCALAPHLSESPSSEILELSRKVKDKFERARLLSQLVQDSPELWPEVWRVTRQIKVEIHRAWVIRELAINDPQFLLPHALDITRNIRDKSKRTFALSALANHFPELWPEVLDVTRNIEFESTLTTFVLLHLVRESNLPEFLLNETLSITRNIGSSWERSRVLIALGHQMPELWPEVLESTRTINNESQRAEVLSELAVELPETLLQEAFNDISDIKDVFHQAAALSSFLSRVQTSTPASFQEKLRILSTHKRPALIQDLPKLKSFMVDLGGKDTVDGAIKAMREVCTQWP